MFLTPALSRYGAPTTTSPLGAPSVPEAVPGAGARGRRAAARQVIQQQHSSPSTSPPCSSRPASAASTLTVRPNGLFGRLSAHPHDRARLRRARRKLRPSCLFFFLLRRRAAGRRGANHVAVTLDAIAASGIVDFGRRISSTATASTEHHSSTLKKCSTTTHTARPRLRASRLRLAAALDSIARDRRLPRPQIQPEGELLLPDQPDGEDQKGCSSHQPPQGVVPPFPVEANTIKIFYGLDHRPTSSTPLALQRPVDHRLALATASTRPPPRQARRGLFKAAAAGPPLTNDEQSARGWNSSRSRRLAWLGAAAGRGPGRARPRRRPGRLPARRIRWCGSSAGRRAVQTLDVAWVAAGLVELPGGRHTLARPAPRRRQATATARADGARSIASDGRQLRYSRATRSTARAAGPGTSHSACSLATLTAPTSRRRGGRGRSGLLDTDLHVSCSSPLTSTAPTWSSSRTIIDRACCGRTSPAARP